MSREEAKEKVEEEVKKAVKKETSKEADDKADKKEGSNKKLILEILSCVICIAAIIVAMIFVLKSKEKNNSLTHMYEKAATLYDPGNIDCWYDVAKDKYYSDKDKKNEIDKSSVYTYMFDRDLSGIVQSGVKHYYVGGGLVDKSFNGFAMDENNDWYYFQAGICDEFTEDVVKGTVYGEEAWWCVKGGKVAFIDTVAENVNGWWRIESGKVNFNFEGVADNENGSWYCRGGKVDYNFTGQYKYNKKIYDIEGGKVVGVADDPEFAGKIEYYSDNSNDKSIVTAENEAALIEGFQYFEGKTGVRPYLYIRESLPSDSMDVYLEELSNERFGTNDGIVIVYIKFEDMFWIYTRSESSIGLKDKTKINEAIRANWEESDKAVRFGSALKAAADQLVSADEGNTDEGNTEEGTEGGSEE